MMPMVPDFDTAGLLAVLFALFATPFIGLAAMAVFATCLRMGLPGWPLTALLGGAVAFSMGTLSLVWTSPIAGHGASTAQLIEWTCICVAAGLAVQVIVTLHLRRRRGAARQKRGRRRQGEARAGRPRRAAGTGAAGVRPTEPPVGQDSRGPLRILKIPMTR